MLTNGDSFTITALAEIQSKYNATLVLGANDLSQGMTLASSTNTSTTLVDCGNYSKSLGDKTLARTSSVSLACGYVNHTIFAVDGIVCEGPTDCPLDVKVCALLFFRK